MVCIDSRTDKEIKQTAFEYEGGSVLNLSQIQFFLDAVELSSIHKVAEKTISHRRAQANPSNRWNLNWGSNSSSVPQRASF